MTLPSANWDAVPGVLVTGGAGFVGSHIIDRLARLGVRRIFALDDLSTGSLGNLEQHAKDKRVELVEGSTSDGPLVAKLVKKVGFVFHLASAVGVQRVMHQRTHTLSSSAKGVLNVLEAASDGRVPVLYTSTSEVYGDSPNCPLREDQASAPGPTEIDRWGYAAAKLFGEFCMLAHHREGRSPTLVVRLFNTVGPRQTGKYGMVVPRFMDAALTGEPLVVYGSGRQTRCFGSVGEVADAMIRLASCGPAYGCVVNIGGTDEISVMDLARLVVTTTGSMSEIVKRPFEAVFGLHFQDITRRVPDVTRLRQLIADWPRKTAAEIVLDLYASRLASRDSAARVGLPTI